MSDRPAGVLNEELSEDEIDMIFRERQKHIDRAFAMEAHSSNLL